MLKMSKIVASVLIFLTVHPPGSHTQSTKVPGGIKVDVVVPTTALIGETVDLKCIWRVTGEKGLYTAKWYKDGHEFFRYVPENNPQMQTFPQSGVFLDERATTENLIRLTKLTLETSGQYKCEVSTEGPVFTTARQFANLTIIDLPKRPPEISGLSSSYAVGENLTANCTAWPSHPRASISWTINDAPVPRGSIISYRNPSPTTIGGSLTTIGLRLGADDRYFVRDGHTASLKCIADVGGHKLSDERLITKVPPNNERFHATDVIGGGGTDLHGALNMVVVILGIAVAIFHQTTLLAT